MRRLAGPLALGLCLILAGCKRKPKPAAAPIANQSTAESADGLASTIQAGDSGADLQFAKGFYPVENGAWRWTARKFTATLKPPKLASQKGARLVLKFVIPDPVIDKLRSIRLWATVNGLALTDQEYSKAGEASYTRDVPADALKGNAATVDFALDKFLPPSAADQRELGVIVNSVGLEVK